MVVDDLDIVCVGVEPAEADAQLFIDANTVLAFAIACELFEVIGRRDTKIGEAGRSVEHE